MAALPQSDPPNGDEENTIAFIFEYAKTFPELQNKDWEAMETKATQVLTAASFILGLASIGSMSLTQKLQGVQAGLLTAGIVAYLVVLGAVASSIWIRDIERSRLVEWAWGQRFLDLDTMREDLIQHIIEAYNKNVESMNFKARCIQIAMVALGFEAVCITAALVSSRLA